MKYSTLVVLSVPPHASKFSGLSLTLRWLTELYVSVVLTLLRLRGLILHEFMLENISNPARVQGSAPTGASEHRNTLREAL